MPLKVGSLYVSVASDIAKISGDFDHLIDKVGSFGKVVKKSLQIVGLGMGIREIYHMGQQTVKTMYKIKRLAEGVGMATEDFAGFAYIADKLDLKLKHLEIGFRKLSTQMSLAQTKGGEAAKIFKDLTIDFQNMDGTMRPLKEVFFDISDRFKGIEDGALKAYYATKLFATSAGATGGGLELVTMLSRGRGVLEDWITLAEKLGLTFKDEVGEKIEKLKMSFKDLKSIGVGTMRQVISGMSEDLIQMAEALKMLFKQSEKARILGEAIGSITKAIALSFLGLTAIAKLEFVVLEAGIIRITKLYNSLVEEIKESKLGAFLQKKFAFEIPTISIDPDFKAEDEVMAVLDNINEALKKLSEPVKIVIDIKDKKPLDVISTQMDNFRNKLKDYIATLKSEAYILTLTNEQQDVYNHLKRAGFELDEKTGAIKQKNFQHQADIILKLGEENRALTNVKDSLQALIPEQDRLDQLLKDSISVFEKGKINALEYAKSIQDLASQYNIIAQQREISGLSLDIAGMEKDIAQNMYSQVTIAKKRLELLKKEYSLRDRYLGTMKQGTEEQISLYMEEVEVMEKLKKQMIDQENIVKQNTSAIYGMQTALRTYVDELANIGQQTGDLIVNVFRKLEDQIIDFIKTGKASFKDMVDYIITELMRITLRRALIRPMADVLLEGISSPGTTTAPPPSPTMAAHKGGLVGRRRMIPQAYYDHAPRLHKGLKANERRVIMEVGEEVTSKEKVGKGSVSIVVPVTIAERNPRLSSDLRSEIEEATERVVRRYM